MSPTPAPAIRSGKSHDAEVVTVGTLLHDPGLSDTDLQHLSTRLDPGRLDSLRFG